MKPEAQREAIFTDHTAPNDSANTRIQIPCP